MATFEMLGQSKGAKQPEVVKFSIKRVEGTIQKFIKVLQMDLERLQKHRNNIVKRIADFDALNKEQMNASRSVQQLKSNLKQLEQTRKQVLDVDLEKFDSMIVSIKALAVNGLQEFVNVHGQHTQESGVSRVSSEIKPFDACCVRYDTPQTDDQQKTGHSLQLQVQEVGENSTEELRLLEAKCAAAEQSWLELEQNLSDMNGIMRDLSSMVHHQQETVDTIEDKVGESQRNIEQGTSFLAQAAKYKGALLPVVGALIGGAVGGPIGLVAGLKLGGAAAVGGGIMGFTGGAFLKKRRDAQIEGDMKDIRERQGLQKKT